MKFFKILLPVLMCLAGTLASFAENSASSDFSITLPSFVRVEPVTSPVLVANITDKTGNLYAPLSTKFRVISNSAEKQTLYLSASTVTDCGMENAMFEQGGRVYIAFANLAKIPASQALMNCKTGVDAKTSAGVVAYPVTSIMGADSKYLASKNKYEVYAENGTTYVTINIDSHVLQTSFAANDPRGCYQAVLSLTEADI